MGGLGCRVLGALGLSFFFLKKKSVMFSGFRFEVPSDRSGLSAGCTGVFTVDGPKKRLLFGSPDNHGYSIWGMRGDPCFEIFRVG